VSNRGQTLQEGFGEFIHDLAKWDVFVTLTFSRLITPNGCIYWVNRIIETWEKMAGRPIACFWAVEQGEIGKLWHLHALVANVTNLKVWCEQKLAPGVIGVNCCMVHSWPAGYARVEPYDPNDVGAFYVAKYAAKQLYEYGIHNVPMPTQGAWQSEQTKQRLYRKHRTRNIYRSN
jgi:hypothetical protein